VTAARVGRRIVATDALSGLGAHFARLLAARGAAVLWVGDRSVARLVDEQTLVPQLAGGARYAALMAASTVREVASEIEQRAPGSDGHRGARERRPARRQRCCTDIGARRGRHDANAGLDATPWADAAAGMSVATSSAPTRIERRFAELPEAHTARRTPRPRA